jgi:heat-inducible transcriptional repressor
MLDDRKMTILRVVVESYIETAEPVGSSLVADVADLGVSSATIRNELVQLDQQGYLTQPHTSAGRIPTDKAYRAFVDALDEPDLERNEAERVKDFFDHTHGEIEEMLDRTSRLLSELTGVTSVVVAPDKDHSTVRSVQLVQLAPLVVLAVMVLSDGTVEKSSIEVVDEIDEVTLAMANGHLSAAMVGRTLSDAATPLPTGNAAADRLVESSRAVLTTSDVVGEMYVGGLSSVPSSFGAIDTVREVLQLLEKQLVVVSLLRDVMDNGMSVSIGNETGLVPLAECSLIVAPYAGEGSQSGTIGLLGPTRMNYPHAMAAVAVVSRSLGKRLSEG